MIEKYLGMDAFLDGSDTFRLVTRLSIMLLFVGLVIRSYVRRYHSNELAFTYWAFATMTFCIAFLLRKVPMELGFALGLFAVFGVLRYRTESIAIKDLTYLFIVIGLALVNALSNKKISLLELLIVNCVVTGGVWLMESRPMVRRETSLLIVYDKIPLLAPSRRAELLRDLATRTGIPIHRFDIQEVNLLRDTVNIMVHFDAAAPDVPESSAVGAVGGGGGRPDSGSGKALSTLQAQGT